MWSSHERVYGLRLTGRAPSKIEATFMILGGCIFVVVLILFGVEVLVS